MSRSITRRFSKALSTSNLHDNNKITQRRPYTLDRTKALDKKFRNCHAQHIKYEMKSGKNCVIQYSTGASELAKIFITNIIQSPEFQQTYATKTQDGKESYSAQVDMCIKVFNRKANGQVGGQLKFTVDLYHTSNTMNINGSRNDIFVNEIFDNLCDTIREQYGTLDIINETISSQLHNLRESSSTVIQNSLRTELVDKRSTNALCETSIESNNTNIKSNTEFKTWTCPICELPVEEDCIACDSCDNWMHFRCAGIQNQRTSETSIKTVAIYVISVMMNLCTLVILVLIPLWPPKRTI